MRFLETMQLSDFSEEEQLIIRRVQQEVRVPALVRLAGLKLPMRNVAPDAEIQTDVSLNQPNSENKSNIDASTPCLDELQTLPPPV